MLPPGMTEQQFAVLKKVVTALRAADIPFQVSGGLAAKLYGSPRTLYDIDLDVHERDIPRVSDLFRPHLVRPYARYDDDVSRLWFLTIVLTGVPVDISALEKFSVRRLGQSWQPVVADLARVQWLPLGDLLLPVEEKEQLIAYKRAWARPEDLADLGAISVSY